MIDDPEGWDIEDPLIDEVRRMRADLSAQFDHDLDKLFAHLREVQKDWPGGVITLSAEEIQEHRARLLQAAATERE